VRTPTSTIKHRTAVVALNQDMSSREDTVENNGTLEALDEESVLFNPNISAIT
jgi:hypothetical protein